MRNKRPSILATTAMLITVIATGIQAQSGASMRVDIPFNFIVGDQMLPAGEYRLGPMESGRPALLIRSAGFDRQAIVLTNTVQAASTIEQAKVVFHRFGDEYYLAQVWPAGSRTGCGLTSPRLRELSKYDRWHETATLVGRNP
ncbi:MAG: hypothetical protein HY650_14645 [Acidobacteria bacterium]|nr:hypothetical protein [Acidobacteriota bacterium]